MALQMSKESIDILRKVRPRLGDNLKFHAAKHSEIISYLLDHNHTSCATVLPPDRTNDAGASKGQNERMGTCYQLNSPNVLLLRTNWHLPHLDPC